MKQRLTNLILILILFTGLSLLLYPTVSDWWNSLHQSRAIASYAEAVEKIDASDYAAARSDAQQYNRTLLGRDDTRFEMTQQEQDGYHRLLNLAGDGIMGILEIPSLDVAMPVYHGTGEAVLQVAVGHIEGTSLPVGGKGTHCALSGHRGLPSARLFTDLDKLAAGDLFLLHILDETLTYEVDRISIVKPHELEELAIVEDQDYCTLVTCTPYGINSHRLLVRGTRVDTVKEAGVVRVTADAVRIDPVTVAPILASPVLLALFLFAVLYNPKKK